MKTAMVAALAALVMGASPTWGGEHECGVFLKNTKRVWAEFARAEIEMMEAEDHKGFCAAAMDTLAVLGKVSLVRLRVYVTCPTDKVRTEVETALDALTWQHERVVNAMATAGCKMPKFGK